MVWTVLKSIYKKISLQYVSAKKILIPILVNSFLLSF
jgi:hypothetical protein